jgi:cell wall-associated NlpC family hydrolase
VTGSDGGPARAGTAAGPADGASFYALGPEFDWLASAWDGFARDLAETGVALRHIAAATAADPHLAAESSGLAALESATERLVRELVDDAARIRRTLATYEGADAAVHASVPAVVLPSVPAPSGAPVPETLPSVGTATGGVAGSSAEPSSAHSSVPLAMSGAGAGPAVPAPTLWHAPPQGDPSAAPAGALSQSRRDILARAEHWVEQGVPYNQGVWHEGYRTDCSGYVSMCWGLGASLVTSTMPQVAHPIAKEDLRAGDVLLNRDVATGHVILFDRWADYAHSSYVGFELCPQGTLHHVIPYPYYDGYGTYEPYRYDRVGGQ